MPRWKKLYEGIDWKQDALLSLAGVFAPKRPGVVPVALNRFLNENPKITTLRLHLDNDEVGRAAAKGIIDGLPGYTILDEPPTLGKRRQRTAPTAGWAHEKEGGTRTMNNKVNESRRDWGEESVPIRRTREFL